MSKIGMALLNGAIGVGSSIIDATVNKQYQEEMMEKSHQLGIESEGISMERAYNYGEKAAQNADARTRALYNDLSSPAARVQQLKDAGLSVGLMYGSGGSSGSITSGAQGSTGGSGRNPNATGFDLGLRNIMSQIRLNEAQADKIDAEADNIRKDTEKKKGEIGKIGEEIKNLVKTREGIQIANGIAELEKTIKSETLLTEIDKVWQEYYNIIQNGRILENNADVSDATKEAVGKKIKAELELLEKEIENYDLNKAQQSQLGIIFYGIKKIAEMLGFKEKL